MTNARSNGFSIIHIYAAFLELIWVDIFLCYIKCIIMN